MVLSSTKFKNTPFALSIGPQRCATSWLDQYLRKRGDICMPTEIKEIRYFDKNYIRGKDFYFSHFHPQSHHKMAMEITTTCFDDPQAPQRVLETLGPNLKLICPLRHPVERSYSLYLHYKRYGMVSGSIEEACEILPQIMISSHYASHIQNWLKYFKREQIYFLYQERLDNDPKAFVKELCAFLDLEYTEPKEDMNIRMNSTAFSPHHALAAGIQNSAEFLRRYKLYKIINLAKSLGLKEVVFGREGLKVTNTVMTDAQRVWLYKRLYREIYKLENLIGPIPYWHEEETKSTHFASAERASA